jgi:hypothetical protein
MVNTWMKNNLSHMIMGFQPDDDFPCLEKNLPISTIDLVPIMGWQNDNDCVFDYHLTEQQICDIETSCSMELPKHLELFLITDA